MPNLSLRLRAFAALAAFTALTFSACKAGEGDACRCASDCKSGLQCAAEGYKALEIGNCDAPGQGEGCCYPNTAAAVCIPASEADEYDSGDSAVDPTADDYPQNKRDFGIETSGASDSATSSTSTTEGTSSTTEGTSSTTDTTGSTTDTTTGSTGSTTDTTGSTTDATTGSTTDATGSTTDATTGSTTDATTTGTTGTT